MVEFTEFGSGVDGDGVPGAPGGNGEGDEVQGIEGNLMAWSTRLIASRSEAEERLERPRAELFFWRCWRR
jgi:hypothetical protein